MVNEGHHHTSGGSRRTKSQELNMSRLQTTFQLIMGIREVQLNSLVGVARLDVGGRRLIVFLGHGELSLRWSMT